MSRDDGFAIADVDAGLMADPKVIALARRMREPRAAAAAVSLYVGLVLASWEAGERLTLEQALPGWWLEPFDDVQAALAAVELVDEDGRILEHAWDSWYGPALARREITRERWRRANDSRRRTARSPRGSSDDAALSPQGDRGDTVRTDPSVPIPIRSVPPRGAKAPRGGGAPTASAHRRSIGTVEVDRV